MKTFAVIFKLLLLTFLVKGSALDRGQGGKSVICYFKAMNAYLIEEEKRFTPEDIDLTICTHLVYSKALVTRDLQVEPRVDLAELDDEDGPGLYNRTMSLKNLKPSLKVFLEVADYNGNVEKQRLNNDNGAAWANFSRNAADYIQNHGFDGMHFLTRNPVAFGELAPILHEEFSQRGIPLMAFIAPALNPNEVKFEMTEAFSSYFDVLVVCSYWEFSETQTTIFSSMASLERVVDSYKALGVPMEKLVVPIPALSIAVKLCNESEHGIGSPVCREEGNRWHEVFENSVMLQKLANASEGWVVVRDEVSKVSYGYSKSLLWTSFEDPQSVREKARFILENKLGGAAIINVEMEDFKGERTEGGVKFPLTRTVFDALNGQQ